MKLVSGTNTRAKDLLDQMPGIDHPLLNNSAYNNVLSSLDATNDVSEDPYIKMAREMVAKDLQTYDDRKDRHMRNDERVDTWYKNSFQ